MTSQDRHNDFESLCSGYVFGSLSDKERMQFEAMLPDATPEQQKLYSEMKMIRDDLALAVSPESPSDSVGEKIMTSILDDHVQHPEKISGSGSVVPFWVYRLAASLLFIATLSLAYLNLDLSKTVETQNVQITELRNELDRQEQLLTVLSAREITFVSMDGLDPSPDGYGKILWDPENGEAVLQLANLPVPSDENDYQLWLIKEGENPISAGVFTFEEPSSDLFFKVEQLDEEPSSLSNTFAVTLEPKGGVPQPTGDMFLIGGQ